MTELERPNLDSLLNKHFAGRVVRKDLTKLVKEGANVPVYVLEYLLGMYANLFYNMSSRLVGLVGVWDVVAFDEVAGMTFKDKDGVQIMKDYMASGSFTRGREPISANASLVFVGNINGSVESLVKTSHLFAPFPETMIDAAFFDRMHCYLPVGKCRRCARNI